MKFLKNFPFMFMLKLNGKIILVSWRLTTIKAFGLVCKYRYKIVQI